jgi:hypothetical protein
VTDASKCHVHESMSKCSLCNALSAPTTITTDTVSVVRLVPNVVSQILIVSNIFDYRLSVYGDPRHVALVFVLIC